MQSPRISIKSSQIINTAFYAHFSSGKIPDCFLDLVNEAMEEEPEDFDAWILEKYPLKKRLSDD
jgi:hypothetical protein